MHLTSVQKREVFVEWTRGIKSGDMFILNQEGKAKGMRRLLK